MCQRALRWLIGWAAWCQLLRWVRGMALVAGDGRVQAVVLQAVTEQRCPLWTATRRSQGRGRRAGGGSSGGTARSALRDWRRLVGCDRSDGRRRCPCCRICAAACGSAASRCRTPAGAARFSLWCGCWRQAMPAAAMRKSAVSIAAAPWGGLAVGRRTCLVAAIRLCLLRLLRTLQHQVYIIAAHTEKYFIVCCICSDLRLPDLEY